MTGAADRPSATIRINARHIVLERCLHQRQADVSVDDAFGTIMLDKSDYRHTSQTLSLRLLSVHRAFAGQL